MQNFYDNRKNISAFVSGAVIQYFSSIKEGREVEFSCDMLKALTAKSDKRDLLDSSYKDSMQKVELFFETQRITGQYSDFQAQLCLDLEKLYK